MTQYFSPLSTIIAAGLSATVAILLFIIRQKNEQLHLIQSKVSDKKYETYNEVLSIFFDLFKSVKDFKKLKNNELPTRIIDAKKLLILYANDKILGQFFDWSIQAQQPDNPQNILAYLDLIILIRKDMGNPDTTLTREQLLRTIVNSDQTYEELLKLISTKNISNNSQ